VALPVAGDTMTGIRTAAIRISRITSAGMVLSFRLGKTVIALLDSTPPDFAKAERKTPKRSMRIVSSALPASSFLALELPLKCCVA